MNPYIRYLIISVVLVSLCYHHAYNQGLTNSPYSLFGIGELSKAGFSKSRAMGGAGIALKVSNDLNDINPAALSDIDSTTFLFDFSGVINSTTLKSSNATNHTQDLNFDHFAFGFSINRWWGASLGLRKMSNVKYDISIPYTEGNTSYTESYTASGGLNKIEMSNAFQYKNFTLGISLNYVWGRILLNNRLDIVQGVNYLRFDRLKARNFFVGIGLQYETNIGKNNKLILGSIFRPKVDVTDSYERVSYQSYGNTLDTVNYLYRTDRSVELPLTYGIGFAIITNKWLTVTADYMHQAWGKTTFFGDLETLKNSNFFAIGAEYIPNPLSINKYFKRVNYRVGAFYNSTYLEVNGQPINEFGLTLGMGFPLRNTRLNASLEIGKKGTKTHDLIQETYAKLHIGFTLQERWFFKFLYE